MADTNHTILIVEDDESYRMLLSDAFEEAGFEALTAAKGEDAMTFLERDPDVILLDQVLPGKNGTEILKDIRGEGVDVPILMLTQKEDLSTIADSVSQGVDGYFVKSDVEVDEMVKAVQQELA